ncbi:MAG: hypothetical protein LUC45_00635 [Paraprevotella sp.]|nr:hypothetical protein [Paraprevotella sp.]
MNKYVLSVALLVASTGAFAQNRLVKKAQGLMKTDQFEEAQTTLTEALNSGETKDMALAWDVQGDLYQQLFVTELNKAAAHQPMDTVKFVNNLYACLDAYEKCNSFDQKQEYAEKNKENEKKFRTFLMYAGQFNFENHDFKGAYKAYDAWLTFPENHKLVADDPAIQNDTVFDKNQVAYYACLAAYQGKDYDHVTTHLQEALNYDKEAKTVRQLHLVTLLEKGDTAQWVDASKQYASSDEGIAQNLLAYYTEKKNNAAALEFANSLLATDPNNKIANYSKGVVLFGEEKYEEALPFFEKSAELDSTFTDAYYNAGVCCCNEGYGINEEIGKKTLKKAEYDKEIAKVKDWYKKAEPFFLKVKALEPDNPQRWASRLKTVYYITGEKAKEAEMDTYLKKVTGRSLENISNEIGG